MIHLTDEQIRAAASSERLTNILSAPGSGKTTVAAERFGFHRFQPGDGRGVVGLTFNRAAAIELSARISSRWGGACIMFPHRVSTFDHLYVDLLHLLLRRGLVTWPGGLLNVEVRDEYRGLDGFDYLRPAQNYLRVARLDDTNSVVSKARRISEPTRGIGAVAKHRAILSDGIVSHEDVRWILRSALQRDTLREAISYWLADNYRALIVDEVYDGDGLDLAMVALAAQVGLQATIIGDPWQALYRWRGAKPERVAELVDSTGDQFVDYELPTSFRFRGDQMPNLATALRSGEPVSLPAVTSQEVDVALGRRWSDLWEVGENVLPLGFRNVENATDAALCLLLDVVTESRLGERSHGRESAITKLKLDGDVFRARQRELMQPLLDDLVSGADPADVLDALRTAVRSLGARRPSRLAANKEAIAVNHVRHIARRLMRQALIPGLTAFQAKGREWDRVGVVLSSAHVTALGEGLRENEEEHCITYVAITRARSYCGRLASVPELNFEVPAGPVAVAT